MDEAGTTRRSVKADVELRTYFPTPIALLRLPGAERVNAELKETILAREAEDPGVHHSNLGGWQSSWDFPEWCGKSGTLVLDTARELATRLTKARVAGQSVPRWRMNAWANVNRSGHGNEFHTHPGAYWSGTYYVDDGGVSENPGLGGEFEIQDPRGVGPAMYAPHLAFNFAGGESVGASELIRPQSGLLVLFPSWLSHAVRPYSGDEARISIAFNFSL